MSKQKSIESIVEDFFTKQNEIWNSGCFLKEAQGLERNLLHTTLQSERDRAEEEKRDLESQRDKFIDLSSEIHLLLKEVEKHQSPLISTHWVKEKLEAFTNPQEN